jgi:hypothetical protein
VALTNDEKNAIVAREHAAWVAKYGDEVFVPEDANPGPKGTDYPLHSLDRSATPEMEAEFYRNVQQALAAH